MHEIQTSLKISTRIILKMIKLILILVTMHSLIFFPTVHPFVSDDVNAKLDSWEARVVIVLLLKLSVVVHNVQNQTKSRKIFVMLVLIKLAIMWFQRKGEA